MTKNSKPRIYLNLGTHSEPTTQAGVLADRLAVAFSSTGPHSKDLIREIQCVLDWRV